MSATSEESTMISTPALRISGPPMPNMRTSARARRAVARRAAYMSPEASPAEIRRSVGGMGRVRAGRGRGPLGIERQMPRVSVRDNRALSHFRA